MYDPNHIVFSSRLLYVVRTEDRDHYPDDGRTLNERFDPRRYHIVWRPGPNRKTIFTGSRYRKGWP